MINLRKIHCYLYQIYFCLANEINLWKYRLVVCWKTNLVYWNSFQIVFINLWILCWILTVLLLAINLAKFLRRLWMMLGLLALIAPRKICKFGRISLGLFDLLRHNLFIVNDISHGRHLRLGFYMYVDVTYLLLLFRFLRIRHLFVMVTFRILSLLVHRILFGLEEQLPLDHHLFWNPLYLMV